VDSTLDWTGDANQATPPHGRGRRCAALPKGAGAARKHSQQQMYGQILIKGQSGWEPCGLCAVAR